MPIEIQVTVTGLEPLLKRMDDPQVRQALHRRMSEATILVANQAKANAPVDTGRLRASIHNKVEDVSNGVIGRIGPNVSYGAYMEFGTGTQSDGPGGRRGRHFPPSGALNVWAGRHGFGPGAGYLVARAIGRRGGLKPRRYLRRALQGKLRQALDRLALAAQDVARRIAG